MGCFVVPDVCPKCDYLCKEQKRQATRGDLYG